VTIASRVVEVVLRVVALVEDDRDVLVHVFYCVLARPSPCAALSAMTHDQQALYDALDLSRYLHT